MTNTGSKDPTEAVGGDDGCNNTRSWKGRTCKSRVGTNDSPCWSGKAIDSSRWELWELALKGVDVTVMRATDWSGSTESCTEDEATDRAPRFVTRGRPEVTLPERRGSGCQAWRTKAGMGKGRSEDRAEGSNERGGRSKKTNSKRMRRRSQSLRSNDGTETD